MLQLWGMLCKSYNFLNVLNYTELSGKLIICNGKCGELLQYYGGCSVFACLFCCTFRLKGGNRLTVDEGLGNCYGKSNARICRNRIRVINSIRVLATSGIDAS